MSVQTYRKKPIEIQAVQWNGGITSGHLPGLPAMQVINWVLAGGGLARFVNEGEEHPLRYDSEKVTVGRKTAIRSDAPRFIVIETLEGPHRTNPQDFTLRGIQGEFYPCRSDIFEATYDRVEGDETSQVRVSQDLTR